jgi:DNA repair protein RadC
MMQIKKMPAAERPQEKLLYKGAAGLSNSELLALIIRTGAGEKSAIQLAEEVIAFAMTNSGDLGKVDPRELMKIDGIGASKACSIIAAMEFSKRMMSGDLRESGSRLQSGDDVARLLMEEMMYENREIFMAIHLNTRLEVESKTIVSIGNLDTAPVHPREVFGPAVRKGAAAVIVAHNHPSGDPAPSPEDIAVTDRLLESSRILGIKLLDHVIIGNGRFTSLKAEGYITD